MCTPLVASNLHNTLFLDHKMALEDVKNPAKLVWLIATIFFTWFLSLSLSTARYQFIWYICIVPAIGLFFFFLQDTTLRLFVLLSWFRYMRLIMNLAAYCSYKPVAVPSRPSLTAKDVTVIIPTVQPYGYHFVESIQSICANGPATIIIVTAGPGNYDRAIKSTSMYPNILVKHCTVQNKRKQICEALPKVRKRENTGV